MINGSDAGKGGTVLGPPDNTGSSNITAPVYHVLLAAGDTVVRTATSGTRECSAVSLNVILKHF